MNCSDVVQFITRRADGDRDAAVAAETAETQGRVDAHLESCAACRAELEAQQLVAAVLRKRPADRVSPAFAARLSARLDDASGWFGIADWRAWTFRLAPVAAALALVTYLGIGASAQSATTIEEWTLSAADASAAAVLWQPDVSAESVMETMLTGEMPASADGAGNVR